MNRLVCLIIAGACITATTVNAGEISVYYPDYRHADLLPSELPSHVTCIRHFSLTPQNTGAVAGMSAARMAEVVAARNCAILVVGGAGRSWGFRSAPMDTLVANIVAAARNNAYDGVEIDWEPLNNWDDEGNTSGPDSGRFQPFMRKLSQALPSALRLSLYVGWPNRNNQTSQFESMIDDVEPYIDELTVGAYGMSGPYPGWVSWPGAAISNKRFGVAITFPGTTKPLPAVDEILARYSAVVPKHKITLGLPAHGHQWSGVHTSLQPVNGVTRSGEFQYRNIVAQFGSYLANSRCPSATSKFGACLDRYAKVPYIWHNDSSKSPQKLYLPYDNPSTIRQKLAIADSQGMHGVAVWEASGDLMPDGTHPLLEQLR